MIWYLLFTVLLITYAAILYLVKNKKRYIIYAIAGSVLGFYFDLVSFTQGYYTYPDFYLFTILGLPFSMTLAEGFSVGIAIYLIKSAMHITRHKKISLPDE